MTKDDERRYRDDHAQKPTFRALPPEIKPAGLPKERIFKAQANKFHPLKDHFAIVIFDGREWRMHSTVLYEDATIATDIVEKFLSPSIPYRIVRLSLPVETP